MHFLAFFVLGGVATPSLLVSTTPSRIYYHVALQGAGCGDGVGWVCTGLQGAETGWSVCAEPACMNNT